MSADEPSAKVTQEQHITPWDVEGAVVDGHQVAINYDKLIKQFGTKPMTNELLERFEKLTGKKPHILLRRGVFFSHRQAVMQFLLVGNLIKLWIAMSRKNLFFYTQVVGQAPPACTWVIWSLFLFANFFKTRLTFHW